MTASISVLLVDDDPAFRRCYRRLLGASDGFRLAGEAGDVAGAVTAVHTLRPDVALVDVQMPGGSGLELLTRCRGVSTRMVLLTTFDLDEYVVSALQAGAAGFLLKNASPVEVLQGIRAVHEGHACLAPEVTARLMCQYRPLPAPEHPFAHVTLSPRELDVLRLVAAGRTNPQISTELHLSVETVRTYLKRLFAKLDVHDRTQLALLASRAGLLHPQR